MGMGMGMNMGMNMNTPSPASGLIMTPSDMMSMTPLSHPRPMMGTTEPSSIPKAFQFDPFREFDSPTPSSPIGSQRYRQGKGQQEGQLQLTATSRPFVPPSLSSLSISGSRSGSAYGSISASPSGAGSVIGSGSGTKARMVSGETHQTTSSGLSRLSSRSNSTGQTNNSNHSNSQLNSNSHAQSQSHSQPQSDSTSSSLTTEQRLAEIWH